MSLWGFSSYIGVPRSIPASCSRLAQGLSPGLSQVEDPAESALWLYGSNRSSPQDLGLSVFQLEVKEWFLVFFCVCFFKYSFFPFPAFFDSPFLIRHPKFSLRSLIAFLFRRSSLFYVTFSKFSEKSFLSFVTKEPLVELLLISGVLSGVWLGSSPQSM